jgi:hypothetical protein
MFSGGRKVVGTKMVVDLVLCGLSVAIFTADPSCYGWWDVRMDRLLWLRWRMSCFGHLAAGMSACVMLNVFQEVDFHTSYLR